MKNYLYMLQASCALILDLPPIPKKLFFGARKLLADRLESLSGEHYKKKNTILVGIIPGPRESSKEQFNHYLRPLVDDLLKLYNGVPMTTFDGIQVNVRAALLMVA